MHLLDSAIEAELQADYRLAIKCYLRLSRQGSLLDRVGIYQAIARCFEKSGLYKKAAYWHERAGVTCNFRQRLWERKTEHTTV